MSDADTPRAGFYRTKLIRGGPWVPVRIWFGPPHDPDTGELMDRSLRWQAERDGKPVDIDRVWPFCGAQPISEQEYRFMRDRADYVRAFKQEDAHASPTTKINLLTSPIPEF